MEWSTKPVPTASADEILKKYKIEDYAEICLVELDRYKAALELTDGNQIDALAVAHVWARSYELERQLKKLKSDPKSVNKIASKFDVAMLYWSMANSLMVDGKDRIAAAKEFAAIAGIYDSKVGANQTNVNIGQCVMLVRDFGTNDNWTEAAAIQQSKLVNQRNEQRERIGN